MAKWAQNPPSWRKVLMVLGIIAIALIIVGLEKIYGLPEWIAKMPLSKNKGSFW